MIVLKSVEFAAHDKLTKFINENKINKESIVAITKDMVYTVFFFGDSEIEEKLPGFWG